MSIERKMRVKEGSVKALRKLLEGKVEQAEIIISAKGFSKELQVMIEKVGRLMNEDMAPVADQMRLTYGQEMSDVFLSTIRGEMENVLNTLRDAKERIDDSVISISQGQTPDTGTDMDSDEFNGGDDLGDDDFSGDIGDDGLGADLGDDLGDEGMGAGIEDEFGGEELASEEPLGRAALESKSIELQNKITEMRALMKKTRQLQEQRALSKKKAK